MLVNTLTNVNKWHLIVKCYWKTATEIKNLFIKTKHKQYILKNVIEVLKWLKLKKTMYKIYTDIFVQKISCANIFWDENWKHKNTN